MNITELFLEISAKQIRHCCEGSLNDNEKDDFDKGEMSIKVASVITDLTGCHQCDFAMVILDTGLIRCQGKSNQFQNTSGFFKTNGNMFIAVTSCILLSYKNSYKDCYSIHWYHYQKNQIF